MGEKGRGYAKYADAEKKKIGWHYRNHASKNLTARLAVIKDASFSKRSGRDDCWWGLQIGLQFEDGLCSCFDFPLKPGISEQIEDFLNAMDVNGVSELIGKPVFGLLTGKADWGSITAGIAINKNLIV